MHSWSYIGYAAAVSLQFQKSPHVSEIIKELMISLAEREEDAKYEEAKLEK